MIVEVFVRVVEEPKVWGGGIGLAIIVMVFLAMLSDSNKTKAPARTAAAPAEQQQTVLKAHLGHFIRVDGKIVLYKGGRRGTGNEHTVGTNDNTRITIDGKDGKIGNIDADEFIELTEVNGIATLIAASSTPPIAPTADQGASDQPTQARAPILFQRIAGPGEWSEPIIAPANRGWRLHWTTGETIRVSVDGREFDGTDKFPVPGGASVRFRSKDGQRLAVAWKAYFSDMTEEEKSEIPELPKLPGEPVLFQCIAQSEKWSPSIHLPQSFARWQMTQTQGRDLLIAIDGETHHGNETFNIPYGSVIQFRSADRRPIAVLLKIYFSEPSKNELARPSPLPHIPGEF